MPAGKPKEWRWVANDSEDFDDDARGSSSNSEHVAGPMSTDWGQSSGWDSLSDWWQDAGRNEWQDDGRNAWHGQTTSAAWTDSEWRASKDVSMQWTGGGGSATDSAMTAQQEWAGNESNQWQHQNWAQFPPPPPPWVEPPPGTWNHNKISMEEAIQWAAEETAKFEQAMHDGEEMAEKEVRLNAATPKAKP